MQIIKQFVYVIIMVLFLSKQAFAGGLNIYNWSDYIAPDTLENFESETGIDITYDVYDSNETLEAKLLAGAAGYDIVVPTLSNMINQIKSGLYLKIDKNKLSNYHNLDTDLLKRLSDAGDIDNDYAVPYLWGTNGIGYNVDKIKARMENPPLDSWDLIFDPKIVSKFSDCGVTLLDSQDEVMQLVLNYLGFDPNTDDKKAHVEAEKLLKSIRPYIKYFHSSSYIDDLANGEICLALGWSGDIFIAIDDAEEVQNGVNIEYVIPREGTIIWFDVIGIPKLATNIDAAYKFIDYILRPKVIADITNEVVYANPNPASLPFVKKEIRENISVYPNAETHKRLFAVSANTFALARMRNLIWARIKARL